MRHVAPHEIPRKVDAVATISPVTGGEDAVKPSPTSGSPKSKRVVGLRWIAPALVLALAADFVLVQFSTRSNQLRPSLVLPNAPQLHELRSLALANPDDRELHLALAQAYLNAGHYLTAREEFDRARRNGADEVEALSGRAKANTELLRYDLAAVDLQRLIALKPDRLETYLALAEVRHEANDVDGARSALHQIPLDPDGLPKVSLGRLIAMDMLSTAYGRLGDWKTTLQLLNGALDLEPKREITRGEKAGALAALGRPVEAIPLLEEAANSASPSAESVYQLGSAYESRKSKGDGDRAFECYKRALQIDNKHGPAMLAFAKQCDRKHFKPAASFAYQQASALGMEGRSPLLRSGDLMLELGNKEEGWFRRGMYFESMQMYDQAAVEYKKLTSMHSCCRSGFLHLARVYELQSKSGEAIDCLQKAQRLDPARAKQLRWSFFQAYGDLHRYKEQNEVLDAMIADGGKEAEEALYQKATFADVSGNNDGAEKWLQRCIQLSPGDPTYHLHLGKIMLQRRSERSRLIVATKHLETSVRLSPNSYEAFYNLGLAYKYSGNVQDAILALRHAVDLQPERGEGYQALTQALIEGGKRDEAAEMQKVFQRFQVFQQASEVLLARCKRDPRNAGAQLRMADFHMAAREHIAAVDRYKKCLAIQPGNRQARQGLIKALGAVGQREEQRAQISLMPGKRTGASVDSADVSQ